MAFRTGFTGYNKRTEDGIDVIEVNDAEVNADFGTTAVLVDYPRIKAAAQKKFGGAMVKALLFLVINGVSSGITRMTKFVLNVREGDRNVAVEVYMKSKVNNWESPQSWTIERLFIAFRKEIADALQAMNLTPPLAGANGMRDDNLLSLLPDNFQYYYHRFYAKWALVNKSANGPNADLHIRLAFIDMQWAGSNFLSQFITQCNRRGFGDLVSVDAMQTWAEGEGNKIYSAWKAARENARTKNSVDVSEYDNIFTDIGSQPSDSRPFEDDDINGYFKASHTEEQRKAAIAAFRRWVTVKNGVFYVKEGAPNTLGFFKKESVQGNKVKKTA